MSLYGTCPDHNLPNRAQGGCALCHAIASQSRPSEAPGGPGQRGPISSGWVFDSAVREVEAHGGASPARFAEVCAERDALAKRVVQLEAEVERLRTQVMTLCGRGPTASCDVEAWQLVAPCARCGAPVGGLCRLPLYSSCGRQHDVL